MLRQMNHDIKGFLGTSASGLATIVGWQSNLEFWLRILSFTVSIIAGVLTIIYYAKRK
jgi:hypothetical protein